MDTVLGENIQTQGPKLHGKKSTYQLASVFPVTITSGHCLKINLLHGRDSILLSYIFLMWKRNGVKTCPYCGGALPPRIRFCISLGGSLYLFTSWFAYILACILSCCQQPSKTISASSNVTWLHRISCLGDMFWSSQLIVSTDTLSLNWSWSYTVWMSASSLAAEQYSSCVRGILPSEFLQFLQL